MTDKISVKKINNSTGTWWAGGSQEASVRTSFRISPAQLEKILKQGALGEDLQGFKLKHHEQVEQFVFDKDGVTVFVGRAVPAV